MLACLSNVYKREICCGQRFRDIVVSWFLYLLGLYLEVVSIGSDYFVLFQGSSRMSNTRMSGENQNDDVLNINTDQQEMQQAPDNSPRQFGDTLSNTNMARMAVVLQRIYNRQCSMDPQCSVSERSRLPSPPANINSRSEDFRGESPRRSDDDRVSIHASADKDEADEQDDLSADVALLTEQDTVVNDQPNSTIL